MQFSLVALTIFIASVAAHPTYVLPRQQAPGDDTQVDAPAIGMTMGCTVMANACKVYIKSEKCTEAWHAEVNSCVPATCTTIRNQIIQQCPPQTEPSEQPGSSQ